MEYNFFDFLKRSRKRCRTREDFLEQVSMEIDLASADNGKPQFYVDKQSYIRRLEGARFAAVSSQFREPDKYNSELGKLLESLK